MEGDSSERRRIGGGGGGEKRKEGGGGGDGGQKSNLSFKLADVKVSLFLFIVLKTELMIKILPDERLVNQL